MSLTTVPTTTKRSKPRLGERMIGQQFETQCVVTVVGAPRHGSVVRARVEGYDHLVEVDFALGDFLALGFTNDARRSAIEAARAEMAA